MTRLYRLLLFLLCVCCLGSCAAETFYVRADGGTRYSVRVPAGQCDGKADAPYRGHGTNQHCAFGDLRYLWDDHGAYGKRIWAIAGGDTVIIRKHFVNGKDVGWRVGFDQNKSANDPWCVGGDGTFSCSNSTVPSGTPEHHTRLLGENYGNCTSDAAKTEIFGGFGVSTALNLTGAAYVDVACLNITRHSDCVAHGDPALPRGCRRDNPVDDYDSDGITTDTGTHDLFLEDLWIHGHTDRGIIGPIGGLVSAKRVKISTNGMAGWDLDPGNGTASINGNLQLSDSIIEWSGCNQQYPYVDEIPVASCYGQSNGGYGDGIGTPTNMGLDVAIDHSIFRYNVQDGEDFGHVDTGSHRLVITNSESYGNGGGQFKWGANFTTVVFENNIAIGNCARMSAPMRGVPAGYNAHLGDFCRAEDAISLNFRQGGTAMIANNTFVSYAPTTFDINCWDPSCSQSKLALVNNIVLGIDNPKTYSMGGKSGGPGGIYLAKPIGTITRSHNIWYGVRGIHCGATELCSDPKLVGEIKFLKESDLDNMDVHLSPGSPARHAGAPMGEIVHDEEGHPRPSSGNYSIGALE